MFTKISQLNVPEHAGLPGTASLRRLSATHHSELRHSQIKQKWPQMTPLHNLEILPILPDSYIGINAVHPSHPCWIRLDVTWHQWRVKPSYNLGNSTIRCRRSPIEPSVISSLDLECFMIRVWLDRKPLILTMMVQMFVRVIRFIRFLKKFWDISEKDKKGPVIGRFWYINR